MEAQSTMFGVLKCTIQLKGGALVKFPVQIHQLFLFSRYFREKRGIFNASIPKHFHFLIFHIFIELPSMLFGSIRWHTEVSERAYALLSSQRVTPDYAPFWFISFCFY